MDNGTEADIGFVVARSDATKFFDFLEEIFDQVAPLVMQQWLHAVVALAR